MLCILLQIGDGYRRSVRTNQRLSSDGALDLANHLPLYRNVFDGRLDDDLGAARSAKSAETVKRFDQNRGSFRKQALGMGVLQKAHSLFGAVRSFSGSTSTQTTR